MLKKREGANSWLNFVLGSHFFPRSSSVQIYAPNSARSIQQSCLETNQTAYSSVRSIESMAHSWRPLEPLLAEPVKVEAFSINERSGSSAAPLAGIR